jgi:hypothetical protein
MKKNEHINSHLSDQVSLLTVKIIQAYLQEMENFDGNIILEPAPAYLYMPNGYTLEDYKLGLHITKDIADLQLANTRIATMFDAYTNGAEQDLLLRSRRILSHRGRQGYNTQEMVKQTRDKLIGRLQRLFLSRIENSSYLITRGFNNQTRSLSMDKISRSASLINIENNSEPSIHTTEDQFAHEGVSLLPLLQEQQLLTRNGGSTQYFVKTNIRVFNSTGQPTCELMDTLFNFSKLRMSSINNCITQITPRFVTVHPHSFLKQQRNVRELMRHLFRELPEQFQLPDGLTFYILSYTLNTSSKGIDKIQTILFRHTYDSEQDKWIDEVYCDNNWQPQKNHTEKVRI